MSSRINLQSAYILHSRPYRDTSVILDVFTLNHGRIGLLARGARSARSRLRGVLQPFRCLLVSWSGRSELRTLGKAEENGVPLWLTGQALVIGFYLNELVLRLLHRDDPHPGIFACYESTLNGLGKAAFDVSDEDARKMHYERVTRIFEKELLRELGYGLILDHDVKNGAPVEPDTRYSFELSRGPVLDSRQPPDSNTGKRLIIHGASLLSLETNDLTDARSLREAKTLLRAALALYLDGRPLNSRTLLPTVKRTPARSAASDDEIPEIGIVVQRFVV